jgi:quinol monooxygenase YgiN
MMLIAMVHVHVNEESVPAFIEATTQNSLASQKEPGVVRFDVVQNDADPTRFVLIEVYRDNDAPAKHKETTHYATWRDRVAPMMAEARTSEKYHEIVPSAAAWEMPGR